MKQKSARDVEDNLEDIHQSETTDETWKIRLSTSKMEANSNAARNEIFVKNAPQPSTDQKTFWFNSKQFNKKQIIRYHLNHPTKWKVQVRVF